MGKNEFVKEEFNLEEKVAIVTGSGRGIGKSIALILSQAGANIAVVARTERQVERTANEIIQLGSKAIAIPADVTDGTQIRMVVRQTVSEFGQIDILVNNAGVDITKPVAFIPGIRIPGWELAGDNWDKTLTIEEWHRIIDTNLTSAFLFAQAVAPYMLRQRSGKIINISSVSAELGTPYSSAYCVSKAGLSALTRCLASEWAKFNICVNAIGPGDTNTDMMANFMKNPTTKKAILDAIPAGRLAEPREIALLALYLASEASSFVNGQTIYIDGGQLGRGAGF